MKLLIVGGTSLVGTALKTALSASHEVITAGRKDCDIIIDLLDPPTTIVFPTGIDAVIHTAASFGGSSIDEILEAEEVNVSGTLKVCHAAVHAGAKHFILISSMFACLKEEAQQYSIYAITKKQSEEVAAFFCRKNDLPLAILRPSQIYGDSDEFSRHQPFLYKMIDKAANGEDIEWYGSNDAARNYIHIGDLVTIISKVIQQKTEGVYACMYPEDITYSQIANSAYQAFNKKGNTSFLKDKPSIPDNVFEKDNSLYERIGFYPRVSMEEGIKRIATFRNNLA